MSQFITYAQNFEDLMLWRALSDVKDGFYVDVGAADPDYESVTRALYERGFRGINLEPGHTPFRRLKERRTEDININKGVWKESGEILMYFVGNDTALSTTSAFLAEEYRRAGYPIREETITVTSLRDALDEHIPDGKTIHFLKIDAEGAELEVIQGHDFTRWRPWIFVCEAHGPDKTIRHYEPYERLLESNGYVFTYSDGLNRFYIDTPHHERLKGAFEYPPNVFDNWLRASEQALEYRALKAEAELRSLQGN